MLNEVLNELLCLKSLGCCQDTSVSCCCCPLTAPAPAPQAHPPPGAIPVIPKSSHRLLPSTTEASAESPPTPLVCGWPGEMQRWFLECHQPPTAPQGDLGVCVLPLSPLPSPQHCCSALSWMQLSLIHRDSSPQAPITVLRGAGLTLSFTCVSIRLAGSHRRLPRLGGSGAFLPALPQGQVLHSLPFPSSHFAYTRGRGVAEVQESPAGAFRGLRQR